MAISWEAETHGLLKSWQQRFRVSPWAFNQIVDTAFDPSPPLVFYQPQREIIATAIESAFDKGGYWLGYPIRPIFIEDENIPLTSQKAWNDETNVLDLQYGHLQGFGTPSRMGNGITAQISINNDTGRAEITLTLDSPIDNLADALAHPIMYFKHDAVDDITFDQYDPRLALPILRASVASETSIKLRLDKADLVDPNRQDAEYKSEYGSRVKNQLGIDDDIYFLTSGDSLADKFDYEIVLRDDSNTATLLSYSNDSPTSIVETRVKAIPVDHERGRFRLAPLTSEVPNINSPFAVKVNYEAGYPITNGRMDPELELAVLRMANAEFAFAQGQFRESSFANYQDDFQDLFDRNENIVLPLDQTITGRIIDLGSKRGHYEAYIIFKRRNVPGKGNF